MRAGSRRDVAVFDDPDRVRSLSGEWNDLAAAVTIPSIYDTCEYVLASWANFDAHHSNLRIIVVRGPDGRVDGLFPLRVRTRRRGIVAERLLEPAGAVQVDRPSVLIRPGSEPRVWEAGLEVIRQLRWDSWQLPEVGAQSASDDIDRQIFQHGLELQITSEPSGSGLLINLEQTWADFLANHKSFRRRLKRFERAMPNWTIDRYVGASEIRQGIEHYEAVADNSWKPGRVGMTRSPQHRRFHQDLLPQLAAQRRTGIRILRNGDDLVAADLTHEFAGRAFFHSAVYDQRFGDLSPGTVFTGLVLREFFDRPTSVGDFLTGYADYLRPWSFAEVPTRNIEVLRGRRHVVLRAQKRAVVLGRSLSRQSG